MNVNDYLNVLPKVKWEGATISEQGKLITSFINDRNSISTSDVGRIEAEFQRYLHITRDEWYRIAASPETDRFKILIGIWQKNGVVAQPTSSTYVAAPVPVAHSSGLYPHGGWIGEFMYEYCQQFESPDSFLFWSGVCALSAVVRRKVYTRFGTNTYFPNFYVILVSTAAQARKGPPIKAAGMFASSIPDVNFIGRTSTEKLPHDMAYRYVTVGNQSIKTPQDAMAFLCAEELVSVLDDKSYNADVVKFLIDWWDCPAERKPSSTHKHSTLILKNIYVTLLGGTTPKLLEESLSHIATGGGMLSRVIYVVESRTSKRFHWPDDVDPAITQRLLQRLIHIDSIQGEFIVTKDAKEWDRVWYDKYRDYIESNEEIAASIERKQAHMIKLAMILALSEDLPLEITPTLLGRADTLLNEVEKGMPETTKSLEATPQGREHLLFKEYLRKAGGELSHSEMLRKFSPRGIDKDMFKKLAETLEEGGQIEIDYKIGPTGRQSRVYRLKP